nr:LysR substrate-binding domain-containing protein [Verrucomicrobium spinosum]
MGCRLLERDTHSVSLTEPGRRYLEDARAALVMLDRAAASLRLAREGVTERLRLAFVGALLDEPLVRLFQKFRETHPKCHLEVTDLAPADQVEAILSDELDGGFIGARPQKVPRELELILWREEELLLGVPEGHPLAAGAAAGARTGVSWKALRGQPWVMVSRELRRLSVSSLPGSVRRPAWARCGSFRSRNASPPSWPWSPWEAASLWCRRGRGASSPMAWCF